MQRQCYIFKSINNSYKTFKISVNAIDCYVCRGCEDVTSNDIQTCPASPVTEDPEFTTNYDGLIQREPSLSRVSTSNDVYKIDVR